MKKLSAVLLLSVIFSACHKEEITNTQNSTHDIFVAGTRRTSEQDYSAAYWSNGTLHDLQGGSNSVGVYSIFAEGENVYCLGYDYETDSMLMWKNEKKYPIEKFAFGTSIVVSNGDVFIAGVQRKGNNSLQGKAKYWKNGVGVDLTDGTNWVDVTSVVVQDNDVYVSGSENKVAKYWKNGVEVNLTGGTSLGSVRSLFVKDNNVYACGFEYDQNTGISVAKYWENGLVNFLEGGISGTVASSIAASNDDLYVAYDFMTETTVYPKYMKNGQVHSLPFQGYIETMKVVDGDLYILGNGKIGNGPYQSVLLKNGVFQTWQNSPQYAYVNCLFVK